MIRGCVLRSIEAKVMECAVPERTDVSSALGASRASMIIGMTEMSLRMTYDPEADAACIYVTDPIEPGALVKNVVLDHDLRVADFSPRA